MYSKIEQPEEEPTQRGRRGHPERDKARCGSLPKLSSQDEDGPTHGGQLTSVAHFEPIPHDHDYSVVVTAPQKPT
ncbi:hypothetical protein FOCC_FOCC000465 [Frankliniella occidentalis]|nr:hypothetical protein FOCC_FOCC000465 [Frankliniella occidentalis]